jgi:saccharopine dehydrogenase-like NADP-dependent oxidoreductase
MKDLRIRYQLAGGQWTYWLNKDQLEHYREDQVKAVVIEETVSYQEYLKFMEDRK